MKKALSLFLVLTLLLSLCACDNHTTAYESEEVDNYSKENTTEDPIDLMEEPYVDAELLGTWYDTDSDQLYSFGNDQTFLYLYFSPLTETDEYYTDGLNEFQMMKGVYDVTESGSLFLCFDEIGSTKEISYQIECGSITLTELNNGSAEKAIYEKAEERHSFVGSWKAFSNTDDSLFTYFDTKSVGLNNFIIYRDGTYELGRSLDNMYSSSYSLIHDGQTINLYKGRISNKYDVNVDISLWAEGLLVLDFPNANFPDAISETRVIYVAESTD